ASSVRLSSVNRRSPSRTSAPSRKCTAVISLSTRDLTATLAIGVTDPSTSRRTGTTFLIAVTTSTGTARGPFWRVACATAPSDHRPPRVATTIAPAATSTTTAPATNVRFFIAVPRRPSSGPPGDLPLFPGARHNEFFGYTTTPFPLPPSQCRGKSGCTRHVGRVRAPPCPFPPVELNCPRATPTSPRRAHPPRAGQSHQQKVRHFARGARRAAAEHRL